MSTLRAFIDYLRSRPEITTPTEMSMGTHHQIGNRGHTVHPDLRENHERARETRESIIEELGKMDQKSAPKADTGPHMITVGDLSANMIGTTAVRVEHEGSMVSGQLMNVRFEVDRDRLYRGGTPEWIVAVRFVEIQVGSIYLDNLEPNHPIELVR